MSSLKIIFFSVILKGSCQSPKIFRIFWSRSWKLKAGNPPPRDRPTTDLPKSRRNRTIFFACYPTLRHSLSQAHACPSVCIWCGGWWTSQSHCAEFVSAVFRRFPKTMNSLHCRFDIWIAKSFLAFWMFGRGCMVRNFTIAMQPAAWFYGSMFFREHLVLILRLLEIAELTFMNIDYMCKKIYHMSFLPQGF